MRRLLALLGRDVSRSLSPVLHDAAARALGVDVAYVPFSCPDEERFGRSLEALVALGARGANVTIPYKVAALERSTTLSPVARAIGAVNTLVFPGGREVLGDNTDGPGMCAVLADRAGGRLARVQVLGAGGAARAVVWALAAQGAAEIHVCARGESASRLARDFPGVGAHPLAPIAGATLVVSTLPPEPELAELAVGLVDPRAAPRVLDLAYQPGADTPLVARSRARGLVAEDGLTLLVEQAARAFALWTGEDLAAVRPPMAAASLLYRGSGRD